MPYPRAHSLLNIIGDSFGSQEIWQTGIRLDSTAVPTTAQFEAVDAAVNAFLSTGDLEFTAGFRYLGLKWAPQTVNGRYPDGADAVEWLRPAPKNGVSQGFPQIACVLSLRTARSRGYASNGRMYWPSACPINTADGLISAADAGTIATAGATMIEAIRDSGIGNPCVMSSVGAGRIEAVTGVRVGRVMDTQRRRRNALPETYSAVVDVPL